MPRYIIERQYLLPVYEQLLIEAASLDEACREALNDSAHPWSENAAQDFDNARPVTITEAVELPEALHPEMQAGTQSGHSGLGELLYQTGLELLAIPVEFTEEAAAAEPIGFV